VASAYALLNCPVGSDLAMVNKVYREASHRHHPDKGGSASMMAGLNRAIGILRAYLSRNARQPASSTV
jgi:curved DNA-binding protein CbpA